jgi:hypothetical protein
MEVPQVTSRHALSDVDLDRTLARARRRWQGRVALRGVASTLVLTLIAAVAAATAMHATRFDAASVTLARAAVYLLATVLVAALIARPLARRPGDGRVALYLERHNPSLDALLLSAVEARGAGSEATSPALVSRLLGAAGAACRRLEHGRGIEREALRRGWLLALAALAAWVLAWALSGPGVRHGLALLAAPWGSPAAGVPYALDVSPGDVTVPHGTDQLISVQTIGFDPRSAVLETRTGDDAEWQRTEMGAAPDGQGFEAFVFDLRDRVEYAVSADGMRSATHRIEVVRVPVVERLELTVTYPAYTGLGPVTLKERGDVSAVRGSEVTVKVLTDIPADRGELVIDGEQRFAMTTAGPELEASFAITADGRYRIDLPGLDGEMHPGTSEFVIDALDDMPPVVSLERPGRDTQVTAIEELELVIGARDDLGVRDLELVLSVNGAEEEVFALSPGLDPREARATHVLYLESRDLEPGDLIDYHVRASDGAPGQAARRSVSDPYFLEVRPFDRAFRRAAGGGAGGGGGGGGAGEQGSLAAQQRTLVVAAFKTARDRETLDDDTYAERVATLAESQTRIRARVDAIVRRIGSRQMIGTSSGYRQMAEELPKASASMLRVEALLAVANVDEALVPAREALRHLQRADAAFREVQIARGQQGTGRGASDANDLANLFRLEMDKFRTQYDAVRRGQQAGTPQSRALDETLERLRELARRQQRELERARARARLGGDAGSGSGRDAQALAAEAEELARALERLSRERRDPELAASAQALRRAADAMRRGAQARSDGPSQGQGQGQGQDQQRTRAQADAAREAAERIREARRQLEGAGTARLGREVGDTLDETERLVAEHERLRRALAELGDPDQPGASDDVAQERDRRVASIAADKDEMATDVRELEARLGGLSGRSRDRQPQVSRRLADAADRLREDEVAERIERSRGLVGEAGRGPAGKLEARIGQSLEDTRRAVADAAGALGEPGQAEVARAAERLRDVLRSMRADGRPGEGRARARGGSDDGTPGGRLGGNDRARAGTAIGSRAGGGPIDGTAPPVGWSSGAGARADLPAPDVERLREGFAATARELEVLREELVSAGHEARDIEAVLRALAALGEAAGDLDAATLERRHEALIAALQDAERSLRAGLDEDESQALLAADEPRVAAHQRALVDEYYRRLSEAPPGAVTR